MVRSIAITGLTFTLAGCSIYQPLIGHAVDPKQLETLQPHACVPGQLTTALKRACVKRNEIEQARAAHQRLNAISANTLIPAAGYVAYRTAREKSVAATSAIAATGLAGYATIGALAPDGRIEAYTRASKALSCGIETYRTAYVSGLRTSVERLEYTEALNASREAMTSAPASDSGKVAAARKELAEIEAIVSDGQATGTLDAQLEQFVSTTIEDLNGLLRGTLPTLNALSADVAALSGSLPQARLLGQRPYHLDDVYMKAGNLLMAESKQHLTADFSACQMSTAALATLGLYKRLGIGPGDSQQGQTINLTTGQALTIPITGGAAPLSVLVSGDPPDYKPSAEITMQGVGLLTVKVISTDSAAPHTYRVTIFDNVGSSRWVDVVVPKT